MVFLVNSSCLGTEFSSCFKDVLEKKYHMKIIHTHTSAWPKISPAERLIRTMKNITFHLFFQLKTLRLDNVLKLAELIYNHRPHRSISYLQPISLHHCTHLAAKICKLNDEKHRYHQLTSMGDQLKQKDSEILRIGQMVRIKSQRSIFKKFQPLKSPLWSSEMYRITNIDTGKWPRRYSLQGHKKTFYAHELLRIPSLYPVDVQEKKKHPRILVNDYHFPSRSYLRSGKKKQDNDPMYTILLNRKLATVSQKELKNYKESLGDSSIAYSSLFSEIPHSDYIV